MKVKISPLSIKNLVKSEKSDQIPKWESWFRRFVKISSVLNILPIEFNRSTGLYSAPKTHVKRYAWYLVLLIYTVDCVCLLTSTRSMDIQRDGAYEYVNFYMHCFVRFSGVVTTWGITLKLHECVVGLNIMISNCRSWKKMQKGFGEDFSGPIERSIGKTTKHTVLYGITVLPLAAPSAYFENRNSKRYWLIQLLLGSTYDTIPGIFASVLIDLYFAAMVMVSGCLILLVVAVYGSIVYFWAATLTSCFRSTPINWNNAFRTYRSIQTTLKILEPTFSKYFAPLIVYLGFWNLVLCVCGLITGFRTLPVPVLVDFLCCLILLFVAIKQVISAGGNVLEQGEELKEAAGYTLSALYNIKSGCGRSRLVMRKQIAACAGLKLNVSNHFYMQRSTFMLYIRLVFERSIDVMLTIVEIK